MSQKRELVAHINIKVQNKSYSRMISSQETRQVGKGWYKKMSICSGPSLLLNPRDTRWCYTVHLNSTTAMCSGPFAVVWHTLSRFITGHYRKLLPPLWIYLSFLVWLSEEQRYSCVSICRPWHSQSAQHIWLGALELLLASESAARAIFFFLQDGSMPCTSPIGLGFCFFN